LNFLSIGGVEGSLSWVVFQFPLRISAVPRVSAVHLFLRFFYRRFAATAEIRRECWQTKTLPELVFGWLYPGF